MNLMPDRAYPVGTVRSLLASDRVTPATAEALRRRLLGPRPPGGEVFDAEAYRTLEAVCARLIPQPDRDPPIDVAAELHTRLADGIGDGWRYVDLPPDRIAYVRGIVGIDQTSAALFGEPFIALAGANRDAVLRALQTGVADGETWRTMKSDRFFEELLAQVVDIYYAHPLAQEEIGYAGMADARGWQAIGLDARDAHEPVPLGTSR